jgi:outer membrane protein
MKNISLIISVVAFIAVIVLYVLFFSGNNNSGSAEQTDGLDTGLNVMAEPGNIAYIRVDSLLMEYNFYNELEDQIKKRKSEMEAELGRKARMLEKDMEEFQHKAQNNLFLSEQSYNTQAEELYKKREELAMSEQQLSQKLMDESMALEQQILDTVLNFMKIFNSDKKYRYIINAGNLLYGEKADDITDTILVLMNERFKLQKEGKLNSEK